ncbi:hypothetical protein MLD38_038184 [Melastoma candidum]|uniref:Uncharacterized protein n=1 Tax=Melastoma candidum TaxID=119954 RepID=A0ACB9KYT6_9MYRT|nr:hypothetical protein MLD38_038184 [Melastoma candidum]
MSSSPSSAASTTPRLTRTSSRVAGSSMVMRGEQVINDFYTKMKENVTRDGHGGVGTLREVCLVSGLPAACSRERLEIHAKESHVTGFRIVGGDHWLENYWSVTTVHRGEGEGVAGVVVVLYVLDVPEGNTEEETRVFVDTIVRCNQ